MRDWFDDVLTGMVERGEMTVDVTPDGILVYRQTELGAEVTLEILRHMADDDAEIQRVIHDL